MRLFKRERVYALSSGAASTQPYKYARSTRYSMSLLSLLSLKVSHLRDSSPCLPDQICAASCRLLKGARLCLNHHLAVLQELREPQPGRFELLKAIISYLSFVVCFKLPIDGVGSIRCQSRSSHSTACADLQGHKFQNDHVQSLLPGLA